MMRMKYLFTFLLLVAGGGWFAAKHLGWLALASSDEAPVSEQQTPKFFQADENTLPFFIDSDFTPKWLPLGSPEREKAMTPKAFRFTDQSAASFGSEDLRGKITIVNFFFAHCPGICPLLMHKMLKPYDELKDNARVTFVSFSVTPDLDTPEVLQRYGQELGVDAQRWHLLTGPKDDIHALARESFRADTNTADKTNPNDFLHSENVFLLDTALRIRGVYHGKSAASLATMVADVKKLEEELAVGGAADEVGVRAEAINASHSRR